MGFSIKFYNNKSPDNKIGKTLINEKEVTGVLRDSCNIMRPQIDVEFTTAPPLYNYMYILTFGRYYFIDDITHINNKVWRISGRVDVLESFKTQILNNTVILKDTSVTAADPYMVNDAYQTKVKNKTQIINFPSGLLNDGTFILVTAGGIGV